MHTTKIINGGIAVDDRGEVDLLMNLISKT